MLNSSPFSVSCHLFSLFSPHQQQQRSNFNLRTQYMDTQTHTHKQCTPSTHRGRERETGAHNSIQFAGLMWHLSTEPTENYRITRTLIESQDDEQRTRDERATVKLAARARPENRSAEPAEESIYVCVSVWHKIIVERKFNSKSKWSASYNFQHADAEPVSSVVKLKGTQVWTLD